jgi:hypothetical protein
MRTFQAILHALSLTKSMPQCPCSEAGNAYINKPLVSQTLTAGMGPGDGLAGMLLDRFV